MVRRVHLSSKHGHIAFGGKLLLGEITDQVLVSLEMYSETAAELVNAHNRKRGAHESTCHDWAIIIVRSLEDALLLPVVSSISAHLARLPILSSSCHSGILVEGREVPEIRIKRVVMILVVVVEMTQQTTLPLIQAYSHLGVLRTQVLCFYCVHWFQ